jgi:hypothetical protein
MATNIIKCVIDGLQSLDFLFNNFFHQLCLEIPHLIFGFALTNRRKHSGSNVNYLKNFFGLDFKT